MSAGQMVLRIVLITLLALLAQGALIHALLPGGVGVNFLAIIVVFLAFHDPTTRGALLCFGCGLLFDIQGARVLGPWAAAFVLVFGVLSGVAQRIFVESTFTIIVSVFGGTLLSTVVALLLGYDWSRLAMTGIVASMMLEALLTALFATLLFPVLKRLLVSRRSGAGRMVI